MGLYIDVHSHLDHEVPFARIDEIIENAKKAGIKHVITNGIDPKTNRKCLELSEKYDIVECGMGIYPRTALGKEIESGEYPLKLDDFNIDDEIEFIRNNKKNISAISEVGLDFVHGQDRQQIEDFQKMIELAQSLGKPIVIHSRKAEIKCIEMLESSKLKKVVMHCFTGRKHLVKKIIDNGWFLTVPTSVVRSQQFQDNVSIAPLSQLFCETDTPYLSPFKDKWNEPSFVVESYKKIAEIKKMDIIEVENNIYMNWQRVFL